jgi:hypothetical protein
MIQEAMQSSFILSKIKKTSWKNRGYINHLLLLFRFMQKQKLSPLEGQHYFLLRNRYQEEYVELLRETNPLKYQVYLEEQEKLVKQQTDELKMEVVRQQYLIEEDKNKYEQWVKLKK